MRRNISANIGASPVLSLSIRRLAVPIALAFTAAGSPAAAGDLKTENSTCQQALLASLPSGLSDTQARFENRRGAGKKQRLYYSLTNAAGRGKATCVLLRGEVQELKFDKTFRMAIAAAR